MPTPQIEKIINYILTQEHIITSEEAKQEILNHQHNSLIESVYQFEMQYKLLGKHPDYILDIRYIMNLSLNKNELTVLLFEVFDDGIVVIPSYLKNVMIRSISGRNAKVKIQSEENYSHSQYYTNKFIDLVNTGKIIKTEAVYRILERNSLEALEIAHNTLLNTPINTSVKKITIQPLIKTLRMIPAIVQLHTDYLGITQASTKTLNQLTSKSAELIIINYNSKTSIENLDTYITTYKQILKFLNTQ